MFRLSSWCHAYTKGDVVALLHSLSLDIAYLPRPVGDAVLSRTSLAHPAEEWGRIAGDTFDVLVEKKFLVENGCDEHVEFLRLRDTLAQNQPLDLMYLLVADGCNLRCRYCFEESPDAPQFKSKVMSEETAVAAVDLFAHLTKKYGSDNPEKLIQLYGGEPLLNKRVVRKVVEHVEKRKKDGGLTPETSVVIITNGLLLDEPFAKYLSENAVSVGISLDGPAEYTNAYRISKKKGVNTYEAARRAYETARGAGVDVGLSVTLTPEVIADFDEVLRFFIEDLGVVGGLNFNILHFTPSVPVDEKYFEDAADCLIRAFERFRDLGIYEDRMMRKVQAFVGQEPIFIDCGVSGNQIVVAPDGTIGACQDFVKPRTYFSGSVFDGKDPVADGLFDPWRTRSPFFMAECRDCPAIAICGGGCPASVELSTGNRWNVDRRICPHSRKSLEWLVWQTYAQTIV